METLDSSEELNQSGRHLPAVQAVIKTLPQNTIKKKSLPFSSDPNQKQKKERRRGDMLSKGGKIKEVRVGIGARFGCRSRTNTGALEGPDCVAYFVRERGG